MRVGRGIGFNVIIFLCINIQAIRPKADPYTHRVQNYIKMGREENISSRHNQGKIFAYSIKDSKVSAHILILA